LYQLPWFLDWQFIDLKIQKILKPATRDRHISSAIPLYLLVGGIPTPLKNMKVSSSVGMMTFPIYGKIQIHVPNHQPVFISPEASRSIHIV
jgi:hypothetical protein